MNRFQPSPREEVNRNLDTRERSSIQASCAANSFSKILDAFFRKQNTYLRLGNAWIKNKTAFKICVTDDGNRFFEAVPLSAPQNFNFRINLENLDETEIEQIIDRLDI